MSKYMREDLDAANANANLGDYLGDYGDKYGDRDLGGGWGGSGYRFDAEPTHGVAGANTVSPNA